MPSVINAFVLNDSSLALITREEGRRVVRSVPAEWVGYFRASDVDDSLHANLRTSVYVRGLKREGNWLRVQFANRIAREDFCVGSKSFVSQLGLETYEADVSPVLRYVIDNDVTIFKPRRVYLDLETDSRVSFDHKEDMRILSWVIEDEDGRCQVGILSEETDRAERDLLRALWRALEPYDQVCAWKGDGFDFPVLWARSEARGIEANANYWLWVDHMEVFDRMNKNASESGEEKRSLRLNDIAQAVVHDGKEITPPEVIEKFGNKSMGALSYELWSAGGEWRDLHSRYNLKDTDLLKRIEEETGYLGVFDALCEASGVFGDTSGLNPTHQMDGFMLRLGKEHGYHFPTKRYREGIEQYKGAFVMEPKGSGILHNVHVGDFKSLYPSIILTWNMSPETKRFTDKTRYDFSNLAVSPLTGVAFDTRVEGILPMALRKLIELRKHWSDLKSQCAPGTPEWHDANRKSTAYKVAANSFYGVVGSPFSRFFDKQIAESITQNGVWLIKETMRIAEEQEMLAVYGDTDSVFVTNCTEEEFGNFVAWCNKELYPPLLEQQGCKVNHIKLAYEKAFERLVFCAAKKYVGRYLHADGKRATKDSKPEIKGLEYKRGDATVLAANLQAKVIDLLCGGLNLNEGVETPTKDMIQYQEVILQSQSHVLKDPLELKEIVKSKKLTKPLKDYITKIKKDGTAAAPPAHVAVAKALKARGEPIDEGSRVEYIVVDGAASPQKCIPAVDYTGNEVDRFHLWESDVFPATLRLLDAAFPGQPWDTWHSVRPKKPRGKKALAAQQTALLCS